MNCAEAAYDSLKKYPSVAALRDRLNVDATTVDISAAISDAAHAARMRVTHPAMRCDALGIARFPLSAIDYCAFRAGGHWWIATTRGRRRVRHTVIVAAWAPRELSDAVEECA